MRTVTIFIFSLLIISCGGGGDSKQAEQVVVTPPPQPPSYSMPNWFEYKLYRPDGGVYTGKYGGGFISADNVIVFNVDGLSNSPYATTTFAHIIDIDEDYNLTVLFTMYDYHNRTIFFQVESNLIREGDEWNGDVPFLGEGYTIWMRGIRDRQSEAVSMDDLNGDWNPTPELQVIDSVSFYVDYDNGVITGANDVGCTVNGTIEHSINNIFRVDIELSYCDDAGFYTGYMMAKKYDSSGYVNLDGAIGNDEHGMIFSQDVYY